jgi:hypothetical protein
MNFEQKYKEYLSYSKEKLIEIGKKNGKKLIETMDTMYGDKDKSFAVFMKLYGTFVAIDLDVNEEEYNMFKMITGVDSSYLEFVDACRQSYDFDVIKEVDYIVDHNSEIKLLVNDLGLAICAYDGKITNEEKALIERYWN